MRLRKQSLLTLVVIIIYTNLVYSHLFRQHRKQKILAHVLNHIIMHSVLWWKVYSISTVLILLFSLSLFPHETFILYVCVVYLAWYTHIMVGTMSKCLNYSTIVMHIVHTDSHSHVTVQCLLAVTNCCYCIWH